MTKEEFMEALDKVPETRTCDALDCEDKATMRGWLRKSEAPVHLCEFHYTRFAVRGLLRTKRWDTVDTEEL